MTGAEEASSSGGTETGERETRAPRTLCETGGTARWIERPKPGAWDGFLEDLVPAPGADMCGRDVEAKRRCKQSREEGCRDKRRDEQLNQEPMSASMAAIVPMSTPTTPTPPDIMGMPGTLAGCLAG
jgi:hypothetical protein